MTNQHFEVDIFRESVIVGNDAIFKCSVPSFVSDFVTVDSWVDSEGINLAGQVLGKIIFPFYPFLMHVKVVVNVSTFFHFFQ